MVCNHESATATIWVGEGEDSEAISREFKRGDYTGEDGVDICPLLMADGWVTGQLAHGLVADFDHDSGVGRYWPRHLVTSCQTVGLKLDESEQ